MSKHNKPSNLAQEEIHPSEIISGHSHGFDTGIARELGLNAAAVYNHIVYWISFNANKTNAEMIDGKYWMYETLQNISNSMGYLTVEEVRLAVEKLVKSKLLIKGNHNKNSFDRTSWYTVHDQSILKKCFRSGRKAKSDLGEKPNANVVTPTCIYTEEEPEEEAEEEAKCAASAAAFKYEEAEETSMFLKEKHGLIVSPFAIKDCVSKYGSDICKKISIQLSKEKHTNKDKSAIYVKLCKEMFNDSDKPTSRS